MLNLLYSVLATNTTCGALKTTYKENACCGALLNTTTVCPPSCEYSPFATVINSLPFSLYYRYPPYYKFDFVSSSATPGFTVQITDATGIQDMNLTGLSVQDDYRFGNGCAPACEDVYAGSGCFSNTGGRNCPGGAYCKEGQQSLNKEWSECHDYGFSMVGNVPCSYNTSLRCRMNVDFGTFADTVNVLILLNEYDDDVYKSTPLSSPVMQLHRQLANPALPIKEIVNGKFRGVNGGVFLEMHFYDFQLGSPHRRETMDNIFAIDSNMSSFTTGVSNYQGLANYTFYYGHPWYGFRMYLDSKQSLPWSFEFKLYDAFNFVILFTEDFFVSDTFDVCMETFPPVTLMDCFTMSALSE